MAFALAKLVHENIPYWSILTMALNTLEMISFRHSMCKVYLLSLFSMSIQKIALHRRDLFSSAQYLPHTSPYRALQQILVMTYCTFACFFLPSISSSYNKHIYECILYTYLHLPPIYANVQLPPCLVVPAATAACVTLCYHAQRLHQPSAMTSLNPKGDAKDLSWLST